MVDRRYLRPRWIVGHLLVLVAVLICLRLGWWQWDRSHEPTGTVQNLGYAVLWPCFGGAFIYMWIRFLKLETLREDEDAASYESGPEAPSVGAATAAFDPSELDQAQKAIDPRPDVTEGAAPTDEETKPPEPPVSRNPKPSRGVTIAVATVGADVGEDAELDAYNQALAALSEKDRRRAR